MFSEFERTGKEEVAIYLKVLSWNLPGGTEENCENP
jgi:hypothetical protein